MQFNHIMGMVKLHLKYYTSYYANFENIPKDYLCIGISRIIPEGFRTSEYSNFIYTPDNFLAPSYQLLRDVKDGNISQEEYSKKYVIEVVSKVKPYTSYKDLKEWIIAFDNNLANQGTEWKGVVFLCYESPSKFCHRQVLRKLLNNYYEIPIEELVLKPVKSSALF